MRLKFKFGDIIVIIIILLAAALTTANYLQGNYSARTAVITQNNKVLQRISLDEQLTDSIYIDYAGDFPGTIEVLDGKIRFYSAECPDQVCVKTGWISQPGQIAVCLPAGVIIKIEGVNNEFDIIVK